MVRTFLALLLLSNEFIGSYSLSRFNPIEEVINQFENCYTIIIGLSPITLEETVRIQYYEFPFILYYKNYGVPDYFTLEKNYTIVLHSITSISYFKHQNLPLCISTSVLYPEIYIDEGKFYSPRKYFLAHIRQALSELPTAYLPILNVLSNYGSIDVFINAAEVNAVTWGRMFKSAFEIIILGIIGDVRVVIFPFLITDGIYTVSGYIDFSKCDESIEKIQNLIMKQAYQDTNVFIELRSITFTSLEIKLVKLECLNPFKDYNVSLESLSINPFENRNSYYETFVCKYANFKIEGKATFTESLRWRSTFHSNCLNVKTNSAFSIYFSNVFLTEYQHFVFATCSGVEIPLNFELYLKPYDEMTWMFILVTFVIILPLIFYTFDWGFWYLISFAFYLVDVTHNIPNKLERNVKFRLILGTSLLVLIVITNAYKGIVVSDLTLPQSAKAKYVNFSQMEDFVLLTSKEFISEYSSFVKPWEKNAYHNPKFVKDILPISFFDSSNACPFGDKNFRFLIQFETVNASHPISKYVSKVPCFTTRHIQVSQQSPWKRLRRIPISSIPGLDKGLTTFPNSYAGNIFSNSDEYILRYKQIMDEILEMSSDCGKIAFVGRNQEVDGFIAYSNNLRQKESVVPVYKKGIDKLFGKLDMFDIKYFLKSREFYKRAQVLFSSGLYILYKRWDKILSKADYIFQILKNQRFTERYDSTPKKLDVYSNVNTAFIIWCMRILMSLCVYVIEYSLMDWVKICYYSYNQIKNLFTKANVK